MRTIQAWAAKLAGSALLAASLAACGPQTPEEVRAGAIAKCERHYDRIAPDPAKGTALCTCLTDKLAEEGLAITDMLTGQGEKIEQIGRSCAASAGVQLPAS